MAEKREASVKKVKNSLNGKRKKNNRPERAR
jgi:hypothetical protein